MIATELSRRYTSERYAYPNGATLTKRCVVDCLSFSIEHIDESESENEDEWNESKGRRHVHEITILTILQRHIPNRCRHWQNWRHQGMCQSYSQIWMCTTGRIQWVTTTQRMLSLHRFCQYHWVERHWPILNVTSVLRLLSAMRWNSLWTKKSITSSIQTRESDSDNALPTYNSHE